MYNRARFEDDSNLVTRVAAKSKSERDDNAVFLFLCNAL